jgi:hypothetical protein
VAVEEGALLVRGAEEALVDPLGRQRRRQRQVAAGEALGEAHQVGRHVLLLTGEHRPGAAEAGRHLVADQQHAEAVAELACLAQEAGRVDEHPGGALDERLDDQRRDLFLVAGEHPLQVGGVAGLDRVSGEEQRPVGRVEEVDAADRDRADRVAVVGLAHVRERGPAPVLATTLLLELEGHLERDLDRGRPCFGVEDAAQPGWRDLDQPRRQLGGAGMGEAEHRRVGDPVELLAQRRVDAGMAMPVDVAPQRGDPIDVAATVAADQLRPLGPLDHRRLFLDPALLLGERVPQMPSTNLDPPPAGTRPADLPRLRPFAPRARASVMCITRATIVLEK